ncbi:hypothetical protein Emed_000605 [Eimeria media]
MVEFGEEKLAELEAFVTLVRDDPGILHRPELAFFRNYLQSLGARIPEPPAEEQPDEPEVESLNDEEVVPPETIPPPELAPTGEKELTDDDYEKLAKAKEAATEAVEVPWQVETSSQRYRNGAEGETPSHYSISRRREESVSDERESSGLTPKGFTKNRRSAKLVSVEKVDRAAVECLVEGCLVECPEGCQAVCLGGCLGGCLGVCLAGCLEGCLEGWPVSDIMANPGNMAKYKDDPEVAEAISKLTRKFGGLSGGNMPGGMPGGFGPPGGFS